MLYDSKPQCLFIIHSEEKGWQVNLVKSERKLWYRSGTVNSKSFIGKVLLRIKWKFELTYAL